MLLDLKLFMSASWTKEHTMWISTYAHTCINSKTKPYKKWLLIIRATNHAVCIEIASLMDEINHWLKPSHCFVFSKAPWGDYSVFTPSTNPVCNRSEAAGGIMLITCTINDCHICSKAESASCSFDNFTKLYRTLQNRTWMVRDRVYKHTLI